MPELGGAPDPTVMRKVVERLAGIARAPASVGEHEAAQIIRGMLDERGCAAAVEEVPAYRSYAWPIGLLCAVGAGSAVLAGRGGRAGRALGAVGGALAALGIADDITGSRMLCRRSTMRPGTATNVVAITGDRSADRTLVVLAHHDAAPSGVVFAQGLTRRLADRFPDVVERMTSNPPLWWPVVAGPALVSAGSALGSRALRRTGMVASLLALAAMVDIGRRPPVPGANDNLSGVAVLVALAEAFAARPLPGLRVLLVSAGAEEALQEGIRGFAGDHFASLPTDRTWFVNVDTVGSGRLVLLEGEGPLRMRDYDARFKDLVAGCASAEGIALLRGLRSHNSTDGAVPRRYGYPVATLVSVDGQKLIPHYHLPSDTPEHVDYECVAGAARLVESVARTLAAA
ncbi:MAG TPA: M28 family peptidase [Pilimelia sp.]|nr:M28 family peptidase [Pilimelia sp.]